MPRRRSRIDQFRDAVDDFGRLAVEEEGGGRRAGRYGVHRDGPAAEFFGEDGRHRFDSGRSGDVHAMGFEPQAHYAG